MDLGNIELQAYSEEEPSRIKLKPGHGCVTDKMSSINSIFSSNNPLGSTHTAGMLPGAGDGVENRMHPCSHRANSLTGRQIRNP